jgi:flagellar basal-body rod protein FlgF
MNVSLYQAAAALQANTRWQQVISENLAASAVPGYKKTDLSFSAVQAGLLNPTAPLAGLNGPMPRVTATTNFQQGTLRPTGENTDLAIEGPGFFEVRLPDGSQAYTRDGEFHINAQGQITTKQGYLVLGESGPLQFDPKNPAPLTISPSGELLQGGETKGRLKLVTFSNLQNLTALGGGYFQPPASGAQPQEATGSALRQGFLENANTSPVLEMANLVSAMRSFETNQRVVQMHDECTSKAISELTSPS